MEIWMYATRIPAISKYKIDAAPDKIAHEMETKIPPQIKWKADNYNHLMEQPTQFYAVGMSFAFLSLLPSDRSPSFWHFI